jgi:hypothetical protein
MDVTDFCRRCVCASPTTVARAPRAQQKTALVRERGFDLG